MTFLASAWLWALPLAGMPALLHLLARRSKKPLVFSDTRLLHHTVQRMHRQWTITHLVLLALRTALLCALILAFARPLIPARLAAAAGQGSALAIVLDASLSMRQRIPGVDQSVRNTSETAFDRGVAAIATLLDRKGQTDQVMLVLADGYIARPLTSQWECDVDTLKRRLGAARPGSAPGTLWPAIRHALSALDRVTVPTRRLMVITDGASSAWRAADPVRQTRVPRGVTPIVMRTGMASANAAILELTAAPAILGRPWPIVVDILQDGLERATSVLELEEVSPVPGMLDRTIISPQGAGVTARTLAPALTSHHVRGDAPLVIRASVPTDALPEDNFRYVAAMPQPVCAILLVADHLSDSPLHSDTYYFEEALRAGAEIAGVSWTSVTTDALAHLDLAPYHVIVLANLAGPDPIVSARVRTFVERGGTVMIGWGPRAQSERYARSVWPMLAAPLTSGESSDPLTPPSTEGEGVHIVKPEHAWMSRWVDSGSSWTHVAIRRTARWQVGSGAEVLLETASGRPLLVTWAPFGSVGGQVIVWGSTFTHAWTTFPAHPAFVSWLYEGIRWIRMDRRSQPDSQMVWLQGDMIRWPVGSSQLPSSGRVVRPDGHAESVSPVRTPGFTGFQWQAESTGVYALLLEAGERKACVNPHVSVEESTLDQMATTRVAGAMGTTATELVWLDGAKPFLSQWEQLTSGVDLTARCAVAALACFLLESMLVWIISKGA